MSMATVIKSISSLLRLSIPVTIILSLIVILNFYHLVTVTFIIGIPIITVGNVIMFFLADFHLTYFVIINTTILGIVIIITSTPCLHIIIAITTVKITFGILAYQLMVLVSKSTSSHNMSMAKSISSMLRLSIPVTIILSLIVSLNIYHMDLVSIPSFLLMVTVHLSYQPILSSLSIRVTNLSPVILILKLILLLSVVFIKVIINCLIVFHNINVVIHALVLVIHLVVIHALVLVILGVNCHISVPIRFNIFNISALVLVSIININRPSHILSIITVTHSQVISGISPHSSFFQCYHCSSDVLPFLILSVIGLLPSPMPLPIVCFCS